MRLFLIAILLFLVQSEIIFQDYGNGNRGSGVSNRVDGANNTWLGNSNTLTGDVNKVKGNDNRVKGSNNIIEGNNNVVGDISPEELARLQNQMFSNIQDRFKGMFNFNKATTRSIPTQVVDTPQQEEQVKQIKKEVNTINSQGNTDSSKSQQQKRAQIKVGIQPKKVPSQNQISMNKTYSTQQSSQIIPISSVNTVAQKISEAISQILLFRSFGNSVNNIDEAYFTQELMEDSQNYLCQRWNYCYEKDSSRMFFSSIYPSFPLA